MTRNRLLAHLITAAIPLSIALSTLFGVTIAALWTVGLLIALTIYPVIIALREAYFEAVTFFERLLEGKL